VVRLAVALGLACFRLDPAFLRQRRIPPVGYVSVRLALLALRSCVALCRPPLEQIRRRSRQGRQSRHYRRTRQNNQASVIIETPYSTPFATPM
jgi:hypothetical protein